jgi:arylsulfatase A-like enzyme|tara:strand:- start:218 stop:1549 length:1332 start_codon:yes stop_codon:yes gene_type:complete
MKNNLKKTALAALPAVLAVTLLQTAVAAAESEKAARPNIILIMADDLGYGDISCYGSAKIKTPNIDALAKSGMKFTDFHSNGPVCSPTRAALLTGRYQQRSGIEHVFPSKGPMREAGLALEQTTIAEVLKEHGYATALFGKWHLGNNVEFNPTKQGFDEFRGNSGGNVDYHSRIDGALIEDWWKNLEMVPEEGYTTDLITKHGVDFIERHKDGPFCLYLAHLAVHSPYQGRNDPTLRLPSGKRGKYRRKPKDFIRAYKEMIEVMDAGIGQIVETVKKLGLERKTFIFFCSDNGPGKKGSKGALSGFKGSLLEGGHRVPAVACWPGRISPGTTTEQTVMGMDLFPTVASIAGAKLPDGLKLDGVDLLAVMTEDKKLLQRTLFWRFEDEKAVRKGPWKLLVRENKTTLYNLDEDLAEKNDLARTNPTMLKRLNDELAVWERRMSN